MKVILSRDIAGVGRKGQVKEVSDGYARNFLIARRLAVPATSTMLAHAAKEQSEHLEKERRLKSQAEGLRQRLHGKTIKVYGKANGQRLFAAIHEDQIAKSASETFDLAIEPKQVIIKQAIKSLGTTEIEIKIFENVNAKVKVEVAKAD